MKSIGVNCNGNVHENWQNKQHREDASGFVGTAREIHVPENLIELEATVRACRRDGITLTVAGAGTGLTGSGVPDGGAVLSTERFRQLAIGDGVAHCGCGVSLNELAAAAARTGQFLGPNPTEISATVGGAVSTNAGGARSFRYGSMRRHVLGMEATFMNGETCRFVRGDRVPFRYANVPQPAVRKNSAGYYLVPDLEWVDLLAGSEGTLAVISAVDLQLFPEPPAVLSGVAYFGDAEMGLDAVEAWRDIPELRLLEYMDSMALELLRSHRGDEVPGFARSAVFLEQNLRSTEDEEVERWADRLADAGAELAGSPFGYTPADRERFRALRHWLPVTVLERVRHNGLPKYGTDFAVPVSQSRTTNAYFKEACQRYVPGKFTIFGHAGDANNHINLLPDTPEEAQNCKRLVDELASYVAARGGTVAAEHGIGKSKRHLLPLMYSVGDLQAMRAVKSELDPDWLLGRGNIFEP